MRLMISKINIKNSILIDEKCNTVKWMKKLGLTNG